MPGKQLFGLAVLLAARHSAGTASAANATSQDANARDLSGGLFGKLLHPQPKAGGKSSAAPAPAATSAPASATPEPTSRPPTPQAAAAIATAKTLYDPKMEQAFAAMAKLTYCGPGPLPLSPYGNAGVFPQLAEASCGKFCESAGFELKTTMLVSEYQNGQKNADFGYISKVVPAKAGTKAPFQCVVAFRGTFVNPANSQTNKDNGFVDLVTPSCPQGSGCQVVSGTYQMFTSMSKDIVKSLNALGCPKGSSIAVTGHSLGGQLAAIAIFMLQDVDGYKVAPSYTFEGSVPFNKEAVQVFERVIGSGGVSYFRITNTNDQVTRFPSKSSYVQPGFQVWHNVPGDASKYVLCGNELNAPDCGTLGIPKDQLCKMTDGGNPDWLQCGGYAPYNGPHCGVPSAPQGNICSNSGMNQAAYVGAQVSTCMMGQPLKKAAPAPQAALQVYPPQHIPPTDQVAPTTAPPPAPTPMPLNKERSQSWKQLQGTYAKQDKPMPKEINCFKNNTIASPISMFGHYAQIMDTVYDCQERCRTTAYCEMFTYFDFAPSGGKGGNCELTGGWGDYVPRMLGSTAGPKDCSKHPPQLSTSEKFKLMQEYSAYIAPQYDTHYALQEFEKHAGGLEGLPGSRQFSLGQVVCVGSAMLALGASLTLLVARTGRLASLLGRRPAQISWSAMDERGIALVEDPEE